jgi:hypothetical protein
MPEFAVLRTHGGLGNQLFQILFARSFAEQHGLILREVHDQSYDHAFPRSTALKRAGALSTWQRAISAIRVPKISSHKFGRVEKPWKLGRTIYLDGYFQNVENYEPFPANIIGRQLRSLADELQIKPAEGTQNLVHLRLGDFFGERESARDYVKLSIESMPEAADLMTNDENLLDDPELSILMNQKNIKLVNTGGLLAEQILRKMACYSQIDANDSTLAFWASVLGGGKLNLSNEKRRRTLDVPNDQLRRCYSFFSEVSFR